MYIRNIYVRSGNHCCSRKAITITYSDCVSVALVNQHAKRMFRILLPTVSCPIPVHFSTLYHTRHNLLKKKY